MNKETIVGLDEGSLKPIFPQVGGMDGTGLTRFRPRILSGHLLHKCIQICSGMTHRVDYGKNSRDTMQHKLLFHYICIALFTGATQNASECHTKNAKTFFSRSLRFFMNMTESSLINSSLS